MVVTEASSFSPLLLPLAAAHSSSCWLSLNAGWFAVVVMHIIIIMLVGWCGGLFVGDVYTLGIPVLS